MAQSKYGCYYIKFRMQLEPKRLLFYQYFLQSQENVVLLNSASIQLSVPFKKKKSVSLFIHGNRELPWNIFWPLLFLFWIWCVRNENHRESDAEVEDALWRQLLSCGRLYNKFKALSHFILNALKTKQP